MLASEENGVLFVPRKVWPFQRIQFALVVKLLHARKAAQIYPYSCICTYVNMKVSIQLRYREDRLIHGESLIIRLSPCVSFLFISIIVDYLMFALHLKVDYTIVYR